MTKKELKEYIREMILQEVSDEQLEKTKEFNKELEKTKELSDELGLTKENKKPKFNINNQIKAIQIQLDQLGVKYEMDPNNKVRPFKQIYIPLNKDDRWYKLFEDFLFRYNLQDIAKPTDYSTLEENIGRTGKSKKKTLKKN